MRVLVLGATGMLGHKLWQHARQRCDAFATIRGGFDTVAGYDGLFDPARTVCGVDAMDFATVERAVAATDPEVVVNCLGVVKQHALAGDPVACLTLNAVLPHRLARLCAGRGTRLLHVSTDCVYSGKKGQYTEGDPPDAADLYGRSKLLGEVDGPGCLTLRTSIIGRELRTSQGLVEWFLGAGDTVRGYTRAVFSGFPTLVLAEILCDLAQRHPDLDGVWHLASAPMSKHDLLVLLARALGRRVRILPADCPVVDRSLNGAALVRRVGLTVPDWPAMVARLAADPTPYDTWRTRAYS